MDKEEGGGEVLSPTVKLRLRKKVLKLLNLYASLCKRACRDKRILYEIREIEGCQIKYLRNLIKPNQAVAHLKQEEENGNR